MYHIIHILYTHIHIIIYIYYVHQCSTPVTDLKPLFPPPPPPPPPLSSKESALGAKAFLEAEIFRQQGLNASLKAQLSEAKFELLRGREDALEAGNMLGFLGV